MTRAKATSKPPADTPAGPIDPFADGPAPAAGGAFIRQADGSLIRDADTEQHVPESDDDDVVAPAMIPPPPPVGESAGDESQEG